MKDESSKKSQKIKEEIKKELEESIVNSEKHNNTEIEVEVKVVERPEDAANVIQEFGEIIRSKKITLCGEFK